MEHSNLKYTSSSSSSSSSSIKMSNSHINIEPYSNTTINIRYTVPYSHDTNTLQNTAEKRPQWYGTRLAKQQSWQEHRVFAHHQCVRFSSSVDDDSSTDNSTTDDDEDEDDEVPTTSKPSWQFSSLAKQFLQSEQECFANTFAKIKVSVQESKETEDEKSEWRQ